MKKYIRCFSFATLVPFWAGLHDNVALGPVVDVAALVRTHAPSKKTEITQAQV